MKSTRMNRSPLLSCAALVALLFLNPACSSVTGPGGLLDTTPITGRIDTALTNITTNGDTWVATLQSLVHDLQGQGLTSAATYVQDILQNGIARVGVEYRCNVDFTAERIRRGLTALKDAIIAAGNRDATPANADYPPFVCSASPDRVSWKEAPQVISLAGYDFSRTTMTAAIVDRGGAERDISPALTFSSPYQAGINLSSAGANFPQDCSKIVVRWQGKVISDVPCLVDCPSPPPPIIVPGDEKIVFDETRKCTDSFLTGCRLDDDRGQACPNGYLRVEPFEVSKVAGNGEGHCGEGDPNATGPYSSHWQTSDPTDCSIHEHIGLKGTLNGYASCRWIVKARRPEKVIPQPAPVIGWCH